MSEILGKLQQAELFTAADVLVGSRGRVLARQKFPISREECVFDLSSLTKPLCTAALCMIAFQEGRASPDDEVGRFLRTGQLEEVPLGQLLNHTSPLVSWHDFAAPFLKAAKQNFTEQRAAILDLILNDRSLTRPPGTVIYSDLGYIVLGAVLEKIYGLPLDRLFKKKIAVPLGLQKKLFFAPLQSRRPRPLGDFVPSEECARRGRLIQGEVMDENAWVMGGVAGHAGLFGTATAIHRVLQEWRKASVGRSSVFAKAAFEVFCLPDPKRKFTERHFTRGFDMPTRPQSQSGRYFSKNTIGHLGFSGTSFWWDLQRDLWIVFLTNRCILGREKAPFSAWRPRFHDWLMRQVKAK